MCRNWIFLNDHWNHTKVIAVLYAHDCWFDVTIYALGMAFSSNGSEDIPHFVFKVYGFEVKIWLSYNVLACDYFEFYGDFLSVSVDCSDAIYTLLTDEFITKYLEHLNLYFDLGNIWNLSLYPIKTK